MKSRGGFLVPYALNEQGDLVSYYEAVRGQKYFCLGCKEQLVVRAGSIKAKHFAHLGKFVCAYETAIHVAAKKLIVEVVRLWKAGGNRPQIQRYCEFCGLEVFQYLPDKVVGCVVECRLEKGYVIDIALLSESGIVAAIEIYVTHLVTEEKSKSLGVPWIELKGEEVIANPLLWKPMVDKFKPYKCSECKAELAESEKVLKKIADRLGIKFPWSNYCTVPHQCYRCGREILVFSWREHNMWTVDPPPFPIPPSVKFSYTKKLGRKYWANTCLYCEAV